MLERRLDAVVYRAKFAPTPFAARQLVSHGHVSVNGKRVTVPSYLGEGRRPVELKAKTRDMALYIEAAKSTEREVPDYIEVDHRQGRGQIPAHAEAGRHPLCGPHGAASGGGILFALTFGHRLARSSRVARNEARCETDPRAAISVFARCRRA